MPDEPVIIKRYPNRRFYDRRASKYVTLADIAQIIRDGDTVEIRDSQTGEDLTRAVLTQIIVEQHPEKMSLFPTAMLHRILQANDMMADFLRGYFRDSLTYLEYLQKHGADPTALMMQPGHWMKTWMNAVGDNGHAAREEPQNDRSASGLMSRIAELEARVRQLESSKSAEENM